MSGADYAGAALADHPGLPQALAGGFDAVTQPELWPETTERLATATGALGVCFHCAGASADQRLRAPMSTRYEEMLAELLAGGWASQDLRASRGWPMVQKGWKVVTENDLST